MMRRTMRRPSVLALFAAVSLSALPLSATAQEPAPTAPTAPSAPTAPPQLPAPPTVDDPMLKPVPRAKAEIASWDDALRYVRARSTDLRIAVEDVTRAEAQQRTALAGALPSLNGTASFTHNLITNQTVQFAGGTSVKPVETPYPNYLTGSLVAVQPLLALRAWHAIGTARVAKDAAKLSLDDAKRLIALSVANAIVGVVTSERIAELNRVGLRNALQRLDLTSRKTALGGGTGLDVVRARQDVEVARATLVTGDESLRQAREALGLALGVPDAVGVTPAVDISGLELAARNACRPADTVDARPDVAALRTRVEQAHRLVNDVKYQFAPTVNLQSGISTTTIDTGAAPTTTWNVQAVLSVPFWEGGARYGNLRDAQAQERQAEDRLDAQRRKASIEIAQARRGVAVAEESAKVSSTARDLAIETDRLTRISYTEGRGTSLELIAAAQALRQAEIELALKDFNVVQSRILAVLALASCPW
jgi:multidrug efflux system outer membrane protein